MATELSFLIELLLEHKLQTATKAAIAVRIKDVELGLHTAIPTIQASRNMAAHRPIQANAEAQALAASLAAQANSDVHPSVAQFGLTDRRPPEPIPAGAVGVTSAAQDAMATRNKLIAEAQAGIAKKGPAVGRGHGTK
jgi:hypothetical protein